MKLFLVAGESSGDSRGVELIEGLRSIVPELEFAGLGGPLMKELVGATMDDWSARSGVIGIIDVARNYLYFYRKLHQTLSRIEKERPDCLILIDYPGFNLRLAKEVKQRFPDIQVVDYISPQVWAWNRHRIPKIARIIDLMLCLFPFETELWEQSGVKTVCVGHPMLDSLAHSKKAVQRDPNLIALLPGSRLREVKKIFPVLLQTAWLLKCLDPHLKFTAVAASPSLQRCMEQIRKKTTPKLPCQISQGGIHDLMQTANTGMIASGTATLEATYFALPHIIVYKAAWLTFFIGRRLVKVQWLGIANILSERMIVQEFLQEDAVPSKMAEAVQVLQKDVEARKRFLRDSREVLLRLGESGAALRAAWAILDLLGYQLVEDEE